MSVVIVTNRKEIVFQSSVLPTIISPLRRDIVKFLSSNEDI
jgi:hypothetical protein